MTWYADESPCDYFVAFGPDGTASLRAIGWLERGQPFGVGSVNREVYDRLKHLLADPWQPGVFMGPHECDLCRYEPGARGYKNLFIPADGFLYVCPELILHYMNAHGYAPPDHFCKCVLACPEIRSMEYRRAILANGGRALVSRSGG
jgi:hypothetical protein